MTKIEEDLGKEVTELELITKNIEMLSDAIRTLDAIVMVLLDNVDIKVPEWKTIADAEKATSEKIHKCVDKIKVLYGPSETDKS